MHVNAAVREQALLRVLQQAFSASEGVIPLADLQQAWSITGLRESDLQDGIHDFARLGCWTILGEGPAMQLQLQPRGIEKILNPPATVEALSERVAARANLFRAARRRRSGRPGGWRRSEDPSK